MQRDLGTGAEPDERETTPRPRRVRLWLLVGTAGVVVAALVATGILYLSERAAYDRAVDAYSEAAATAGALDARIDTQDAERQAAASGLAASFAVARSILEEKSKDVIDVDARAALAEFAEGLEVQFGDELPAEEPDAAPALADRDRDGGPGPLPDAGLDRAEIEQLTARIAESVSQQERALVDLESRTSALTAATADLEGAVLEYLEATVVRAGELRKDRDDAEKEQLEKFDGTVEALGEATVSDAGDLFAAYLAAAAGVVDSSDKARAQKRSGSGGGGGYTVPPETIIDNPSSLTAVVNKRRALPTNYVPPGLVVPSGVANAHGQPVRSELVVPLQQMAAAMKADTGRTMIIQSAYRSFATQRSIYTRYVRDYGQAYADSRSARPGHSEHQTGLGVDLFAVGDVSFSPSFGTTTAGKWLRAHAHEYGFILRYDEGMSSKVGYSYEPWHFRYVGIDVATAVKSSGMTLEQYFGLPDAPDYG